MMSGVMKIGDLAQQTGLSIRTLHHYDKIGLLSPSHRTESGHRLYSEQDIIRLQQILSLRQLGFSLPEIHECLENPTFSLPQVIDLHCTRIREQMAVSRTLLKQLTNLAQDLKTAQSITVETLLEAMETITMTEHYLTQDQRYRLEVRFNQGQAEWQNLLSRARTAMEQGHDLNSPQVQQLARRCRETILGFVGGNRQIYDSLITLYQQEGAEAASLGSMDAEILDYILKTVAMLVLREELADVSFENFAPDALQVLGSAQEAMRELHLNFVGTEGLLLGLLVVKSSDTSKTLNKAGVTFETVQALVQEWLGSFTLLPEQIPANIPFTPRVYRVLNLAAGQSKQLHATQVDTGHLLLGILKEGEEGGGMAMRALVQGCGVEPERLKRQLSSPRL